MELLQLRYFYESACHESFTKTAKKYMVPASSVSASVRQLEKELGCQLFDRLYNHLALNNNGKILKKALHSIFYELDSAIQELAATDSDTREIKILVRAMRASITDYIIEFNKENPHIKFSLDFDFDKKNFEDFDVIIDEKNDSFSEYESFELFNIRICLNTYSGSPLLNRKITLKDLRNQPFLSLGEHSNMHSMLVNNCKRAGFTPNIIATINDIMCYEKMIESGLAIGIRREPTYNSGKIRNLDVSDFNEKYLVHTYYKNEKEYGNVERFLSFLRKKSEYSF